MKKLYLLAALCAAVFISGTLMRAADSGFPIYFENSKLIVKAETINHIVYLPLVEIVQFMRLPYTDALAIETFTIRAPNERLVLTKNSMLISINEQIVLLQSPILREDGRWLVPAEFLTVAMSRITGTEFRYRGGTSRMFAGVNAPELIMNAQTLGPTTRLTIRVGAPANVTVNRDDPKRTLIHFDRSPLDPLREKVDHNDQLVHSILYDDSDGTSKIAVETTDDVAEVRVTPAEGNEIFFVDFTRKGAPVSAMPEPEPPPPPVPDRLPNSTTQRKLRVIVIDPGHGGMDVGTKNATVSEKDLTLDISRKLRSALQSKLGITVLLTRDADVSMDNEARTAVANNNQANLFISLHVGFSEDEMSSGSSVFVMKEDFGESLTPTIGRDRLFQPWFFGYRASETASHQIAKLLQEELSKAIPGWKFPLRSAPLGALASITMPGLALEIGNLNNPVNAQTLTDAGFQTRLVNIIVTAVQRFAELRPGTGAF
jgi:N-acetylmuramoyl-L-alanine amidase